MTRRSEELRGLAERKTGRVLIGTLGQPMRNGSCEVWLQWEARLLPARICEGGGWYSASTSRKAWQLWTGLEHKGHAPHFDKVADFRASETVEGLEAQLAERVERFARQYGFRRALAGDV